MFLKNGFAGTSMDAVTKEAGVSKQTVYSYYASKDDLLIDVLMQLINTLSEDLVLLEKVTINNQNELQQELRNLAHQYIRNLTQSNYLELIRIIIAESPHFPQLGELFSSALPKVALNSVSTVLEQAKNKGLIQVVDKTVAIRVFVGPLLTYILLDGLIVTDHPFQSPKSEEIDAIVDLYMKSLIMN